MEHIIFEAPESVDDLQYQLDVERKCKFAAGTHNTKLLTRLLLYNGIEPTQEDDFALLWATSPESDTVKVASPLQKVNHFPYSKQILGNKAELARILQNNEHIDDFDSFFPASYVLPEDRDALFKVMKANPNMPFIAKPPEGSCGHGIRIVTFADFYTIHREAVVSEYVARPLTIDGFKFDLRIYVLVTSFAPLRAFVYHEGLARFATESYAVGKGSVYSQLTNASLNKHGANWSDDFKWKLSDLLLELEHRLNRSQDEIMDKILRTVAQTLALVQPSMVPRKRTSPVNPFFELYGFDLLLDRDFNMWLLEINTNPSMGYSEEADYRVKGPLLASVLSIVGVLDADEEIVSAPAPQVPEEDIDEFEKELVRDEDERNEASGGGFIRIFPSEENADLEDILVHVPYVPQEGKMQRKPRTLNPRKLALLFTPDQLKEILIAILVKLERKVRTEYDSRSEARLFGFLTAQGYRIQKTPRDLRACLKSFISSLRQNEEDPDAAIPESVNRMIMNSGDEFLFKLLDSGRLEGISDIKSLFV